MSKLLSYFNFVTSWMTKVCQITQAEGSRYTSYYLTHTSYSFKVISVIYCVCERKKIEIWMNIDVLQDPGK